MASNRIQRVNEDIQIALAELLRNVKDPRVQQGIIKMCIRDRAEPVAKAHGCELWDVEYVKEAGGWFLRIYIDKEDGVSITDCEAVSRALDPVLDERDPIPDSYTFEVSSAGAERTLKRPSDFERFMGHLVEVKLYKARDNRKEYVDVYKRQ